jgi:hypothetical protein
MKIVNLTASTVRVWNDVRTVLEEIIPSGLHYGRIEMDGSSYFSLGNDTSGPARMAVFRVKREYRLPPQEPGVMYLVPRELQLLEPQRGDLLSVVPELLTGDEEGSYIGFLQ